MKSIIVTLALSLAFLWVVPAIAGDYSESTSNATQRAKVFDRLGHDNGG